MQGRMPAEVWDIEAQGKARVQQVQAFGHFVGFALYVDDGHRLPQSNLLFTTYDLLFLKS
jgi:hypothetical protein